MLANASMRLRCPHLLIPVQNDYAYIYIVILNKTTRVSVKVISPGKGRRNAIGRFRRNRPMAHCQILAKALVELSVGE